MSESPYFPCPGCGHTLGGLPLSVFEPKHNHTANCLYCGVGLVFNRNFTARLADSLEGYAEFRDQSEEYDTSRARGRVKVGL